MSGIFLQIVTERRHDALMLPVQQQRALQNVRLLQIGADLYRLFTDSTWKLRKRATKSPCPPASEPRCLSEQSSPVNEPQSFNDQADQPQDASDSMVARASATSTSETAVATERGEMYSLPSFSVAQELNFM